MTQDEAWMKKYEEVAVFIEANKRNPSRYDANERGLYCNWIKHNMKMMNSGEMKEERVERFGQLPHVFCLKISENERKFVVFAEF